jgi:hypothetical protein
MRFGFGMARRRTTRRKTTTRRRRSPKPMLNVANAAQTVIVANAATTAFFGTDLQSFLLDGWARPATKGSDNSWELSLAEIVQGLIPGGQGFGFGPQYMANAQKMGMGGFTAALQRNLQSQAGRQALATMVFAPIAFKVGKKVLQKPLINPVNKGLKQLGLASVVKV